MKKGIVMEVRQEDSVVLSGNQFLKVKNKKAMAIGQEILFTDQDVLSGQASKQSITAYTRYISIAASLIILFFIGMTYYNDNITVYTAVTMDINPSIEIDLNRKDEVVEVVALNDDGTALDIPEVIGLPFEEAVSLLLDEAIALGYIVESYETNVVFSTIILKDDEENKAQTLSAKIDVVLSADENPLIENITVTMIEATKAQLDEAIETGLPTPIVVFDEDLDLSEVTTVKALFEQTGIAEVIGNGKGHVVKTSKLKDKDKEAVEAANTETNNETKEPLGMSQEHRQDLVSLINKLVELKTIYSEDGTYSDFWVLVDDYLARYEAESFTDYKIFKDEGQDLLNALNKAGAKLMESDEEDVDEDNNENTSDDETADILEKLQAIEALRQKFLMLSEEEKALLSSEDLALFNQWMVGSDGLNPEMDDSALKLLVQEGNAFKKHLREMYGIKLSDDEDEPDASLNKDESEDEDDEDKGKDKDKDPESIGKPEDKPGVEPEDTGKKTNSPESGLDDDLANKDSNKEDKTKEDKIKEEKDNNKED